MCVRVHQHLLAAGCVAISLVLCGFHAFVFTCFYHFTLTLQTLHENGHSDKSQETVSHREAIKGQKYFQKSFML